MNMRQVVLSVLGGTVCLASSAFGALNLELTRGMDSAMPIAVVPFQMPGERSPTSVSEVIANDLTLCGQFRVPDLDASSPMPHEPSDVDYHYWKDQKVDHVVIGREQSAGGSYQVRFNLLDVFKGLSAEGNPETGASSDVSKNAVILKNTYQVNAGELRRLSHRISDAIYQELTGVRGIFSTKIAYILVQRPEGRAATYSLEVADVDGYNPRPIVTSKEPLMSPAWSPDGRKIAYVSFENRRASIFVSDVASGARRLITQFDGINGAPSFAPDGRKLAIVLSKSGGGSNIYTVNLQNGQLTPVTNDWSINTEPSWSPDGKSIIFTSNRGGAPQIYSVDLSSHETTRLTYSGDYNASASYTSDGSSMVLLHQHSGQFDIAVQEMRNGDLTVLTRSGECQSPSIAPNGKMVIYAAREGNQGLLKLVSIDGRVELRLPESRGEVRSPAWSPYLT